MLRGIKKVAMLSVASATLLVLLHAADKFGPGIRPSHRRQSGWAFFLFAVSFSAIAGRYYGCDPLVAPAHSSWMRNTHFERGQKQHRFFTSRSAQAIVLDYGGILVVRMLKCFVELFVWCRPTSHFVSIPFSEARIAHVRIYIYMYVSYVNLLRYFLRVGRYYCIVSFGRSWRSSQQQRRIQPRAGKRRRGVAVNL